MFKNKIPYLTFTLFCVVFIQNINAQLSKKHFIPPLTYAEEGNANPENQYFYISTPSNQNVNFTIKQIGLPNSDDITGVVSSTNSQEIFIANGNSQLFVDSRQTSVVHSDKGFIIEADDVIYVSIRVLAGGGSQAGALVSKGSSALGQTFRAGMFTNENPATNYLNFISVMATEDNTNVTFSDLPVGISIKNSTEDGSSAISFNLNEGESYILATNAADNDINKDALIGTLIESDKNIVTNVGSANGSFHNGGGRDYGIDQIVDISKVGKEYIFVKGDGENDWENILVVAHEDNTSVSVNQNTPFASLNKGEYVLIEGNNFNTNGNMFLETSNPVFVYQGIGANESEANQGLFFVPPLSCENKGNVDNIPNIDSIGNITFTGGVTIVTNTGANVTINTQPITNFNASGPFNVDGNPNYVTYKVTNLTGNTSIESDQELYCAYFNQNGAASSGGFYSGFPSNPEINFDATIAALGNCIGNDLKLQAANNDLFDTFEWFFNDGTGFNTTGITTPEISPTLPGKYQLKTTITCTTPATEFFSTEINVSICPDDYDGDLIIDNLDVDIDNDGILNCDESRGNGILDFTSNTIILSDGGPNASIISNNTFSGNNSGNFTSTLNIGATSNISYELNFTETINFNFTQNSSQNHTISEGEFFIIKIGPSNKNITLLDPDNQLLVDTNSDDEFEAGVTQISASEIRFKYAADLTGTNATFQFVANQVNEIIFEHNSNALTSNSTFNGNIQLTCFALDSDGDGIENMLDLDSENDGIPDLYDAFGNNISLLNADTNLDGLDDVFDSITTNLDSDEDGIKNYLDIDSDNDGIFDSTEANHNLDIDFDGFIDVFTDANNNGFEDNLEDASAKINYTIADTDGDTVFNFIELDSDNDDCLDVTEAGFTDANTDGLLDSSTSTTNTNGKVINNIDGYTNPNLDYTTTAPIVITNFENVIFCESNTDIITIDTTADGFQWEISIDNGTSFSPITNNTIYNGANTKELQISDISIGFSGHQFRVVLTRTGNACSITSNAITLTVNALPVIKNNPEIDQCISINNTKPTINLTTAEKNISETDNISFQYFEDITGLNEITNIISYPVQINIPKSVYVKVISDQNCSSELIELKLNIGQTPDNPYNKIQTPVCDDLLDIDGNDTPGLNDSTDNISNFSLDKNTIIQEINPPVNTEIFFYENFDDRTNSINEIDITNYRNNINKIDIITTANGIQFPIYYKIISTINNNCQGLGEFYLQINTIPEFTIEGEAPNEPILICSSNIPYTLEVDNYTDAYDYVWKYENTELVGESSESIIISEGGNYTVTAFDKTTGCASETKTSVVVKSSFQTLDESFVTIIDDTSGNNSSLSVRVDVPPNPLIAEEFQYALENEDRSITIRSFQDSNTFENIEGGVYTVVVNNKNGCSSDATLQISVIQFPKFFSPNNDGKNDTWVVKGASNLFYSSSSNITIFDRFGNLVAQTPIEGEGWDGIYNGKTLPSNDYWYNIQLIPLNNTKTPILKKGHFSLLRK